MRGVVSGFRLAAVLLLSQGLIWLFGLLFSAVGLVLVFGIPMFIYSLGMPRDWVLIITVAIYAWVGYQIIRHWDEIKDWFARRLPDKDA